MNLIRLAVDSPGDNFTQLYKGAAEVALLTHPSLVSLFDPAYEGYVTLSGDNEITDVANVRQVGETFVASLPNNTNVPITVDDMQVIDTTGANNNWKDSHDFPDGDFTVFAAVTYTSSQNGYFLSLNDANPFAIGCSTDFKPRFYAQIATGSSALAISSTADFVEDRMSIVVAQYTYADSRVKMWVDGVLVINTTLVSYPLLHTVNQLVVGSYVYTGHDPNGVFYGNIGFAGLMTGTDETFEPIIRTFALERFPTALAHVPAATVAYPASGDVLGVSGAPYVFPTNTSLNVGATISIPQGLMALAGGIEITTEWSCTSNANAKDIHVKFGGTTYQTKSLASTAGGRFQTTIWNKNNQASQKGWTAADPFGVSASGFTTSSVDTGAADVNVVIDAQKGTGADTLTLEAYIVRLLPAK